MVAILLQATGLGAGNPDRKKVATGLCSGYWQTLPLVEIGFGAIVSKTNSYRADIDGLRAIAVLAVVLYHYKIGGISGGFTGVDVFFVISGFLITRYIYDGLAAGSFSFLEFYSRRIRRIMPGLLAMLVATLAAGYFLLLPDSLDSAAWQAGAAALGVSNFYFLGTTGYFDRAADLLPFLHTWSLGVEEQFYLVWPFVAFLVAKISGANVRTGLIATLAVVCLLSFPISVWQSGLDKSAAFYMPYNRAWELALGGLVSFAPRLRGNLGLSAAVTGTLLIAAAIAFVHDKVPFPGWAALLPCLGAALLVWPKESNPISKILSMRPFVFIGLISYSLYLWHWPILTLYRHFGLGDFPGLAERFVLLGCSLVVAWLSWKFVELPFRIGKRSAFSLGWPSLAALASVLAAVGVATVATDGGAWRIPQKDRAILQAMNYVAPSFAGICFLTNKPLKEIDKTRTDCAAAEEGKKRVLLVGDSFALHFATALRDLYPEIAFTNLTPPGCRPVVHTKGQAKCTEQIGHAFSKIIPESRFDAIILSARWVDGQWQDIGATIKAIQPHAGKVIVIGHTMEYNGWLTEILLSDNLLRKSGISPKGRSKQRWMTILNEKFEPLVRENGGEFWNPLDVVCKEAECQVFADDGAPMQWDHGHFTQAGARLVISEFRRKGLLSELTGMHSPEVKTPVQEPTGVTAGPVN